MTDQELAALKKQIEDEEERRRQAALAAAEGDITLDTTVIENKLDTIITNLKAEVAQLDKLNITAANTYAKLEELSLHLLNALAIGLPLLQSVNKG